MGLDRDHTGPTSGPLMTESKLKEVKIRLTETAYDRLHTLTAEHECASANELVRKLVYGLVPGGPLPGPDVDKVGADRALSGPTKSSNVATKASGGPDVGPVPEGETRVQITIPTDLYDYLRECKISIDKVCRRALQERAVVEAEKSKK